ncbi:MAG: ThuA domain-containing protein [Bacteroidota bacterium]
MNSKTNPLFNRSSRLIKYAFSALLILSAQLVHAQKTGPWLQFSPPPGQANGKHIVLVGGDEAYRSEESLPMLAQILSERHGFRTTVLFSINPETQFVDPNYHQNIPGLEFLSTADLMIIATRFRELPDDQMEHIHKYFVAGKPVIGLRTATHAFYYSRNPNSKYAKYGFKSSQAGWEGGFGKRILGENWVNHHGANAKEGTRALINGLEVAEANPILKGVNDIWTTTEVYGIKSLPVNSKVLLWGQGTEGMTPTSTGIWTRSIMPVAWTRSYQSESGKSGRVFTTTMGAAIDFLSEDLRRLIVNASYWTVGLEKNIPVKSNVDFVGTYKPTMFGMEGFQKGKKPEDFK